MEITNISLISLYSTLNILINQAALYIYLIIGSIAIITDVLNIGVLYRRAILISPCPFIVSSLVYICIRCSRQFWRIYYPEHSLFSDNFCKIEVFTIYLLPVHATFMLVLASIDRFLASPSRKSYCDLS